MTGGDWEADLRRADAALANWRHDAADFRSIAECVADAVAAERERVLAPIRALAEDMAEAIDSGYYGGSEYENAAARLRAVLPPITQAAAPAASPADQPEGSR